MAFDLNRFYRQLDEHYAAHDNAATEQFLKSSRSQAYQQGLADLFLPAAPPAPRLWSPTWPTYPSAMRWPASTGA